MKKGQRLSLALLLVLTASSALMAQTATPPPQTFSATVYLDYRFFLSSGGPITLKPTNPADTYLNNQFVFRRAYFTYENKINDNLKFRFRLDADNTANVTGVSLSNPTPPATLPGVTLSKDDKLRPYMKHLYFEWSNFLFENQTLNVGMEETLTFKLAEDRWNYRSVAKTIVDGYKDITGVDIRASSADIGVSLKGNLMKYLRYGIQVVNGGGYTHLETDKYKKLEGYLHFVPVAGFSVFGYADYEPQQYKANPLAISNPNAYTFKLDSYFEMIKGLVVAGEWFTYKNDLNQYTKPGDTVAQKYNVSGWSVFGRYNLMPDKLNAFARYDSYTPNNHFVSSTGLAKAKDLSLVILGLDWAPLHSSLKFQPNVWIYNYKDGHQYKATATSNTDVQFNMTFFLAF
ncbi:MAG TPA: hypothetical protein VMS75_09380 [Terriglobales bacterium]|nr:hypothetical protein [Terriglobales bacterium]